MDKSQSGDITIAIEDIHTVEATALLEELSENLHNITGDSGQNSFDISDMDDLRAVFVIARDEKGNPLGCGCIRPISGDVAELKRMYARQKARGIGKKILLYLEKFARDMGYNVIWLETRSINDQAVNFYLCNGFIRRDNYGKYVGIDKAVCFEKRI